MRSRMHPRYYLSRELFDLERRKIFRKVWLFVGLKTLLSKHNAFLTRNVAGIPIVVQNFHGEIKAFENICLHRCSLIQKDTIGCRPLVCPYHAWRYDSLGKVESIPNCETLYQFDSKERRDLKLREFYLRSVGTVLFINLDPDPFPLEAQFSAEFLDLLESSSNAYDREVMVTTWNGRFNWKLAYENLRDANHPRFVHPTSLAKAVNFVPHVNAAQSEESLMELQDTSTGALHHELRRFSFAGADAPIPNLQRFAWHDMVERWGNVDSYFNWLAFPNLHIASTNGGYSFTLEHHTPVAPGRTNLEIYWFTARKRKPYAFSSQVLLAQMHGSKLVVGEDVEVMEGVQAALHEHAPLPCQGAYESMNRLVERWYRTLMETPCEI